MRMLLLNLWDLLRISGPWLIISFTVCGLLHGVLRPEAFQKALGNKKFSSIVKSTVSGMLLPICSCGVLPLTIGLYYSGAYLGPTLAFLIATPIINPAAMILSFALLGPQLSIIYIACGFILPVIVGVAANRFGGELMRSKFAPAEQIISTIEIRPPLSKRLVGGLKWGYEDLAVQTCRFMLLGTAFAALVLTFLPATFIRTYLSDPGLISLVAATFIGALIYACAYGHIPFVAALVITGTAPGIALAFLLAGVATNLLGMISVWKLIGKRAVFIYSSIVIVFVLIVGYAFNMFFADGFVPQFDQSQVARGAQIAGYFNLSFPESVKTACAAVISMIGLYSWAMYLRRQIKMRSAEG